MSVKAPINFWNAAEAGKAGIIKISLWQRQVRNEHAAAVDRESSAEFVGDLRLVVGGNPGSEGARMLSALRSTSGSRVKVEQMSPLLLSSAEVMQSIGESTFVMKDELTTQVADLRVRIGSCNRSAAELEELLTQHMMECLHQRRLAQKLLEIVDYARHPPLLAPHCSAQDLEAISDALKVTITARWRPSALHPLSTDFPVLTLTSGEQEDCRAHCLDEGLEHNGIMHVSPQEPPSVPQIYRNVGAIFTRLTPEI